MLEITGLDAWYGRAHVLQGVSLEVKQGEIVCLIGRNGAGKTTTLKSVMGLAGRTSGSVRFRGTEMLGQPAHGRYAMGLAYVPEERRIVPGLTVRENIRLGLAASPLRRREAEVIDRITATFPRLRERLGQQATTMSGGEQQMLAIARAMASEPAMVLLDEPSEGIMPVLVDEMFALFAAMRDAGTTLLLVEQNVELALAIADRAYVMESGTIVTERSAAALLQDPAIRDQYCAV